MLYYIWVLYCSSMKTKLNRIFILIALALFGIIIFQIYWTVNAYKVNKEKFDRQINVAMQNAMDDCKKDYFDSIRRVLIKHLTPPETVIRIDTLRASDSTYDSYAVLFLNKKTLPAEPYIISKSNLLFYRKKINHSATIPELFTEISFYEPTLMNHIKSSYGEFSVMGGMMFSMSDIRRHPDLFNQNSFPGAKLPPAYYNNDKTDKPLPAFYQHLRDSAIVAYFKNNSVERPKNKVIAPPVKIDQKPNTLNSSAQYQAGKKAAEEDMKNAFFRRMAEYNKHSVYDLPPDYRKADSLKLLKYYKIELNKLGIYSPFKLAVTAKSNPTAISNLHYAETDEVDYKYFGFKLFGIGAQEFYMRAKFLDPQYRVLRGMILTLLLSLLLVAFVIFCFIYIIRTFIEQKKLAELKDDFINNMTHELKTPIATITVAIEGMQKFNALNDSEKTQRYLQVSRNELSRLNNLVSKVLDIATFENKKVELQKEAVHLNNLIDEVMIAEQHKTAKTVQYSFSPLNLDDTVWVDRVHIRNMIGNIIDNAVKYSKDPVEVTIKAVKTGKTVVISVKDNGIGIPAAHLDQIFDKFHRVPTGNVHNVKGTGLGLSYVKYIVEAHGGAITVKSEVGKGTEFTINLPAANG